MRVGQHLTQLWGCSAWMTSLWPAGQNALCQGSDLLAADSIHSCESRGNCQFFKCKCVLKSNDSAKHWHVVALVCIAVNSILLALELVRVVYVDCVLCVLVIF